MGYTMYRSEGHFSRALCASLMGKVFYQRLESGITGRGIPDLYLRWKDREMWIELKNQPRLSVGDKEWVVDWRKGQQAWAMSWRQVTGKYTYTIVAMKDGYIVVPMNKRYLKKIVKSHEVWKMGKLKDILEVLKAESCY